MLPYQELLYTFTENIYLPLREKCPNTQNTEIYVFSSNTGKYGPEITTYLDTFHAVLGNAYPAVT